jgi:predicted permease
MRILAEFWADVRFAARLLRRSPGFTFVAVSSLALGIGGATAIFTVTDAVVLKSLPVREPGQLYIAQVEDASGSSSRFSYPLFEQAREVVRGSAPMCASSSIVRMLITDGAAAVPRPDDIGRVQLVSGEYFAVLGTRPQVGRLFEPRDNRSIGAHPVAVLSDAFWARRFGRRPDIVNRLVTVNGTALTVIGVTPPGFFGTVADTRPDVWVPVMMQSVVRYANNADVDNGDLRQPWVPQPEVAWLTVVVRARTDRERHAVADVFTRLLQQQLARRPDYGTDPDVRRRLQARHVVLAPGSHGLSRMREQLQSPLAALFAMVGLLLVIACANLAGLLLARSASRRRELAVRVSIGAGRGRIVRQLLAESLLLGLAGGALGIVAARWGCDVLLALFAPGRIGPAMALALDRRVLLFATTTSVLTALGFGLLPALRASRVDPAETLNAFGRIVGGDRRRHSAGRLLVVAQLALTVLLLSVAALFARTLQHLARVPVGYNEDGVVIARIDPRAAGYGLERLDALHRAIVERLETTPGVRSASLSLHGPLSGGARVSSLNVEGFLPPRDTPLEVQEDVVTPQYFQTVGLTLKRGRLFGPADHPNGHAAIINETMARRFFAGRDPIGRHWNTGGPIGPDAFEIVGVVSDAHYNDLRSATPNAAYRLASQSEEYLTSVEVRTGGPAAEAAHALRGALAAVDPHIPVMEVSTLDARVRALTGQERTVAVLAAVFGAAALLVACLGLYGILAYHVTRRTPELGVRIALGAGRGAVLWLVMRDALVIVALGLAIGLPLTLAAAQQMTTLLYQVAPVDVISYTAGAVVLATIAALAAWIPARRAAAIEPIVALRSE